MITSALMRAATILMASGTVAYGVSVSPMGANLTFQQGSEPPPPLNVIVENAKSFTVDLAANPNGWLDVSPRQGSGSTVLRVVVDPRYLTVGTYLGVITVTDPSVTSFRTATFRINLAVTAPPPPNELSVTPTAISMTYALAGTLPTASVSVTSDRSTTVQLNAPAWLVLSAASGATPLQVRISPNISQISGPGRLAGEIVITSASTSVAVPVVVNVTAPVPVIAAVTNAAGLLQGPLSPGAIFTAFGTNLGPEVLISASPGPVSSRLSGVRVLVSGRTAQLLYVSKGQLSGIIPYGVGVGQQSLIVEKDGVPSGSRTIDVRSVSPALFTLNSSGAGQAAALNQDSSLNVPSNPVERGAIVVLYATGEGATDPPGIDGSVANDIFPKPRLPVSVQVGDKQADVLYAGAAPGLVAGVMQVNARIPITADVGNSVPVYLTVGSTQSRPGVFISVKAKEPRSDLNISFSPNPVIIQPKGTASFSVKIVERNGVGVRLEDLFVDSRSATDLLNSFGSRYIAPNGTVQGDFSLICPCTSSVASWSFRGTDDNGNVGSWTARLGVANE